MTIHQATSRSLGVLSTNCIVNLTADGVRMALVWANVDVDNDCEDSNQELESNFAASGGKECRDRGVDSSSQCQQTAVRDHWFSVGRGDGQ